MQELHIHDRLNNIISILDRLTLTGFSQFNSVATSIRELATLDQDIYKWENETKEQPKEEPKEEP